MRDDWLSLLTVLMGTGNHDISGQVMTSGMMFQNLEMKRYEYINSYGINTCKKYSF